MPSGARLLAAASLLARLADDRIRTRAQDGRGRSEPSSPGGAFSPSDVPGDRRVVPLATR
jgi:hypothetical protein